MWHGSSPRAGVELHRGADSQNRRRAAHALPAIVPAAAPLGDGLPVPAPVSAPLTRLMRLSVCPLIPSIGSLRGGIAPWGIRFCV